MANLSKDQLMDLLYNTKLPIKERVIVTPIIDKEKQIGAGAIDLRLGTKFIYFKRHELPILDPSIDEIKTDIKKAQEIYYCKYGKNIVLHPREFVLGSSLEFIRLPNNISCDIVGRSSWGRLGLVIETSPIVHPCFMGVITFELSNLGNTPIALYPGCRIAQISFYKIPDAKNIDCLQRYVGKYKLIPEPTFSRIYEDDEFKNKIFNK